MPKFANTIEEALTPIGEGCLLVDVDPDGVARK